jgi:hypothetical protein
LRRLARLPRQVIAGQRAGGHSWSMLIQRSLFLTLSSVLALGVGSFALLAPEALLESKGVALPSAATAIWVREVGVTIFVLGVMLFLLRKQRPSPTLRVFFWGNALIQLGLFPIEIGAYRDGVITHLAGIIPNSVVHVLLASGFSIFAVCMRVPVDDPRLAREPE